LLIAFFQVFIQNVPCGTTGVACAKTIEISTPNEKVVFSRDRPVTIGNDTLPDNVVKIETASGLIVKRVAQTMFVAELKSLGFILKWDGGNFHFTIL
jgi:hypothetical protein